MITFIMFVRYKAQTLPDVYKITKLFLDINFNAQLKFWTDNKMETWFWILGWILSILTIAGNGFTVLLVGGQPRLRTKTNALIVSLSVADFCVGAFVVPSLFFCDIRGGCNWPRTYGPWVEFVKWLVEYASIMNLCSLVLDRYMAIVKPLKYVNFMTMRRITKLIFFSWVIPLCIAISSVFISLYLTLSLSRIVLSACGALLEIFFSCMLIFCFISMATVVYKQTRSSAILAKQLRFNHQGLTFNTHDKSAVVMLAVVVVFALACFPIYLRCSLQLLGNHTNLHLSCKSDIKFRIPMLVLNSAINPLAYAFFKHDIKRALEGKKRFLMRLVDLNS